MAEPTLDEFLKDKEGRRGNAYVRFTGFSALYVRYTQRYLKQQVRYPVLDLANLAAKKPGRGSFTELFHYLRKNYPHLWLYVECVQTERFEKKLIDMGFTKSDHSSLSACFFMEPVGESHDN